MQALNLYYRIACVGLIVTFAGQAQTLGVSPQQVSFASPLGSTTPMSRIVTILSSSQTTTFAADVRYLGTTTGWLSVSPAAGTTPADLTITANPARLPAGTYLGQVTIRATTPGTGSTGAVVNVLLTVESGSGSGAFVAVPTNLTFLGQPDVATLPAQTLTITSPSGSGVGFDAFASSTGNWLSVIPSTGTAPATLTISASQVGLPAGTYTGTITITPRPTGNPTIIPVTLVASGINVRPTQITLSQSSLTFYHQAGRQAPSLLQNVSVDTPGELLDFRATASQPWLKLSTLFQPAASSVTGSTPGLFRAQVDPALLNETVGTYNAQIQVEVAGLTTRILNVTLTITNSVALNADPSSVIFDYVTGSDVPAAKTITIATTGAAALTFTTATSAPWLRVTPASASTVNGSADIHISIAPVGLPGGTFTGVVTLTIQGGSAFNIPVTLNVTSTTEVGEIVLSTTEIAFAGIVGSPAPSQTVLVTASDLGPSHNFTASASSAEGWLVVSPFTGRTPASVTVSVNQTRLPGPGTYEGTVVVTSLLTSTQQTISVSFMLAERAIAVEPSSVRFVEERRGVSPPPQTIQITSNTPNTFTISELPAWLRVSPMSGSTPATVTLWAEVSAAPPGTTNANILITASTNQISLPVSLMLLPAPAPTASPESLAYTYQLGSAPPEPRTLTLSSTTGEPVSFTVSTTTETGGNWLSVTPTSGTTPTTLSAVINTAQLVPGRYTGAIAVATANTSAPAQTVAVTLTVTAANTVLEGVLHGATFASTPISPGLLVTLTGTGFGPTPGVTARPTAAGAYETRLANVRVLFDGVAAPLLYVGSDQINAIVPYAVYGRLSARVQVESGTSLSIPIEAKVVDAAPGIFTANGLGRGQAAASNSDFTTNSPSNPAARGSIVTIFGTGEGQTDPPGQDGRVILNDLRRPLLQVTARIGGRPAEIVYVGSAATLVSGVFQANIRVPADIEAGNASLEIQVGGAPAQSGVTIAVR